MTPAMSYNSSMKLLLGVAVLMLGGARLGAQTANDGTTADNLVRLSNAEGANGAESELFTDTSGTEKVLRAEQTSEGFPFFAYRSAWYAANAYLTTGVYTVSAEFRPGATAGERRGGVAGWINATSQTAITLQVVPAGQDASFQVNSVNFKANNATDNESPAHLFNLDGTPATEGVTSAWSSLEAYSPTNFAKFQLAFTAPTVADKAALAGVTAHVTATISQKDVSGQSVQVGRTVELLTDLPLPSSTAHRFGYYAYWGSIADLGVIGHLDNLSATGSVVTIANTAPTITLTAPANNTTFTVPANITVSANASDSDGTIRRVEFYLDDVLAGSSTTEPYSFTVVDVAVGTHRFAAKAIDDRGGSAVTANATVTVRNNALPTASITFPANNAKFSPPTNIVITAQAADTDGSVASVEFFVDSLSLGTATTAPYEVTWSDPANGDYTLTVVATDDKGALSTNGLPVKVSIVTTLPPSISIISPTNGAVFAAPGDINFQVHSEAPSGSIASVTLFANGVSVSSSTPGSTDTVLTWKQAPVGTHSIVAQVTDDLGQTANSATISITVNGGGNPGDAPKIAFQITGTDLVLSWPATATGYRLQSSVGLTPPWTDVASANNRATVSAATGSKFYRLIKP